MKERPPEIHYTICHGDSVDRAREWLRAKWKDEDPCLMLEPKIDRATPFKDRLQKMPDGYYRDLGLICDFLHDLLPPK